MRKVVSHRDTHVLETLAVPQAELDPILILLLGQREVFDEARVLLLELNNCLWGDMHLRPRGRVQGNVKTALMVVVHNSCRLFSVF